MGLYCDFWYQIFLLLYWHILWNVCSMLSIVTAFALVGVEMLWEKFLSLNDSCSDGYLYKGPILLINYCTFSSTMLSTIILLKPDVPDVGWFLRRSYSCWVKNGTNFAYVLSISIFLRQILSFFLKILDAWTLL